MVLSPNSRLNREKSQSKSLSNSFIQNDVGRVSKLILAHLMLLLASGGVVADYRGDALAHGKIENVLSRSIATEDMLRELEGILGGASFRAETEAVSTTVEPKANATPLRDISDICKIFADRPNWRGAVTASAFRWGAPIEVQMAILWHESRFRSKARPPKRAASRRVASRHISSAYGYPQALDGTWEWYQRETENHDAARDEFKDATDFVGWYMAKSRAFNAIEMHDAFHHYLAYHEGHGGFGSREWQGKKRLRHVASRVARQAAQYRKQLRRCTSDLKADLRG